MLMQTIREQIKAAMRSKEAVKLDTLRFVLSTLKYKEIEVQRELTDDEILDTLGKEVKKRRDAIALFAQSGRTALVAEEEEKLAIILELLPAQMSQTEIESVIDDEIAVVGTANMGMLMKAVLAKVKGRADGKLVSDLVRQKIAG